MTAGRLAEAMSCGQGPAGEGNKTTAWEMYLRNLCALVEIPLNHYVILKNETRKTTPQHNRRYTLLYFYIFKTFLSIKFKTKAHLKVNLSVRILYTHSMNG